MYIYVYDVSSNVFLRWLLLVNVDWTMIDFIFAQQRFKKSKLVLSYMRTSSLFSIAHLHSMVSFCYVTHWSIVCLRGEN